MFFTFFFSLAIRKLKARSSFHDFRRRPNRNPGVVSLTIETSGAAKKASRDRGEPGAGTGSREKIHT